MTDKKTYYTLGSFLWIVGTMFVAYTHINPDFTFAWPNWVTYGIYGLYVLYIILIFCMPRFEKPSLTRCLILAIQFIALALIMISIGIRSTASESNWYLPAGLFLSAFGNFWNAYQNRREKKES